MRALLSYLLAIVLLFYIFNFFLKDFELTYFLHVGLKNLIISFLLGLLLYFISGFLYSQILFETTGKSLTFIDMLAFPLARNLWGYLLPFQGAFLYSLVFFKHKYGIKIFKTTSINIYILMTNIFITGAVLIYVFFIESSSEISFLILGLTCLLSPFILIVISLILNLTSKTNFVVLEKIRNVFLDSLNSIVFLIKNYCFSISILLINLVHIIVSFFLFFTASEFLKLNLDVFSILSLIMVSKIMIVIKITPGNLGVEQLVSGFVVSFFNYNPADGIALSIFIKFITLSLSMVFGSLFFLKDIYYTKQVILQKFKLKK